MGTGLIEILLIAVGLSMDAFAVALGVGASGLAGKRSTFRISFHFGLFQFLMPVVGWLAGAEIDRYVASYDHWLAFLLLVFIGGKMIREALKGEHPPEHTGDPTKGSSLVMLSVATSIDALAVGFTLGVLQRDIWYPSVVIGCVTAALSFAGIRMGKRLSSRFGAWVEIIGGLVLIGIGLKILLEHL